MTGEGKHPDQRRFARWLSTTTAGILFTIIILGGVAAGLVQINVQKWAEKHGWDSFLVRWWDAAVVRLDAFLSGLLASHIFWWVFGFFAGTTAILWLLRRFPDLDAALFALAHGVRSTWDGLPLWSEPQPLSPAPKLAAPIAALQPQSKPTPTLESIQTRQRALRELGDYIDEHVRQLAQTGKNVAMHSYDTGGPAKDELRKAGQRYLAQIRQCYAAQARILSRYGGIDDVFALADWNYFAKVLEPATVEYLTTVELLPDDPASTGLSQFGGHPSVNRFLQAVDHLPEWINDALRNIGNKRSEYDKMDYRG